MSSEQHIDPDDRHVGWLTAGDMATGTGNSLRVVRHYQQLGLIRPLGRTSGGHRAFHPDELHRLRLISTLRDLGMSLKSIGALLAVREHTARPTEAAEVLGKQFGEIQDKINGEIRRLLTAKKDFAKALKALDACMQCDDAGRVSVCCSCEVALNAMPEGLSALWLGSLRGEGDCAEDSAEADE